MQQLVDFPAQQSRVFILVFAAVEDQAGGVELRDQPALDVANQRQKVFSQRIHQVFWQRKAQHLFHTANQQGHPLFNPIAVARRMGHAVAAVETIFKD
ncbi:Uncharacterised protein [Klebsiella pneumoniae]|nr:Uncharacterised protein [Klebsiella pneumoniae]